MKVSLKQNEIAGMSTDYIGTQPVATDRSRTILLPRTGVSRPKADVFWC